MIIVSVEIQTYFDQDENMIKGFFSHHFSAVQLLEKPEKSGRLSNPETVGEDSRDNLVIFSSQAQNSVTC